MAPAAGTATLSYEVDAGDVDIDLADDDLRRRREYREAGDLGGELIEEIKVPAQGVHTALADRVFRYVGRRAKPVGRHSAVANGGLERYASAEWGSPRPPGSPWRARRSPPSATVSGGVVLGAVNGVLGAELDERDSPLTVRMGLWADGRPVTPTRNGRPGLPGCDGSRGDLRPRALRDGAGLAPQRRHPLRRPVVHPRGPPPRRPRLQPRLPALQHRSAHRQRPYSSATCCSGWSTAGASGPRGGARRAQHGRVADPQRADEAEQTGASWPAR